MEDNRKSKVALLKEVKKLRKQVEKFKQLKGKAKKTNTKKKKDIFQEENLLRAVIDMLPDAVYVKDIHSRKLIANLADLRNMGKQSESEVVGKDDFAFFPREQAEKFFADDQSVIKNAQPVINREEFFINGGGIKHWLLTSKVPLWDEKGVIVGIVGISRDITAWKETELKLKEQMELNK